MLTSPHCCESVRTGFKVHENPSMSEFGSLADSLLYVAHPSVPVLFGGSVELVHLGRTGVGDEEHTSLVIGYVPHDEVVNGEDWRFVLDMVERRWSDPKSQSASSHSYTHDCQPVYQRHVALSYQTWKDVLLVLLLKTHQDVGHQ